MLRLAVALGALWTLLLSARLTAAGGAPEGSGAQEAEAAALQALRDSLRNFESVTASLPGAAWADGSSPCSADGAAWRGVTCGLAHRVTALDLSGLGLEGSLPPQLAALPALERLNLSGNALGSSLPRSWLQRGAFPALRSADLSHNQLEGTLPAGLPQLASHSISLGSNRFKGSLPHGWISPTLESLDLSFNFITGQLPASWAAPAGLQGKGAMPRLTSLRLAGNSLSGPIPSGFWALGSLDGPLSLELRPGNEGACGPVVPVTSQLYIRQLLPSLASVLPPLPVSKASQMRTGHKTTNLLLTHADLLAPGTSVSITNRLGSCARRCAEGAPPPAQVERARLPWPPVVATNLYDLSWQYNMSMSDLLLLNPEAGALRPGAAVVPACYGPEEPHFPYLGSDVAFGQFAGGNQLAGIKGIGGAMAASRINGALANQYNPNDTYSGSVLSHGGGLALPRWWFVDMQATFQVSSVVVAAAEHMTNISLYVGCDSSSLFANKLVASGLSIPAGQQVTVPAGGAPGRYVVIFAGDGTMALDNVQVYAAETNAAAGKPVARSLHAALSASGRARGGGDAKLAAVTDGDAATCVQLLPGGDGLASAVVDLGYTATVGLVAAAGGAGVPAGAVVQFWVHPGPGSAHGHSAGPAAPGDPTPLHPGSWVAQALNQTGRFVEVRLQPGSPAAELCEVQVHLLVPPASPYSDASADAGRGRKLAGAAVSLLAGAAALAVLVSVRRQGQAPVQRQGSLQQPLLAAPSLADYPTSPVPASGATLSTVVARSRSSGGSGGSSRVATGSGGSLGSRVVRSSDSTDVSGGTPRRTSQLEAAAAYISGLLHRGSSQGSQKLTGDSIVSQQAGSRRPAGGSGHNSNDSTGSTVRNATTDLAKVPLTFADVSPADITLVHTLGEGSYGEVWLANYCSTLVAAKIFTQVKNANLTASLAHQATLNNLRTEASLMSNLRHPNICRYLGACAEPPALIMEYCSRRSLDMLLSEGLHNEKVKKQLNWERLLRMALDAASGMRYLHTRTPALAHRDLKSANLLVDGEWRVKVSDFNLSRPMDAAKAASTVLMTNPRWLAPCVLSGLPGQLAADVWAFGTVLWELMAWQLPFEDMNPFQIIVLVRERGTDSLPPPPNDQLPGGLLSCYDEYVALMRHCRNADPEGRPSFDEIVRRLRGLLDAEIASKHPPTASNAATPRACVAERSFSLAPEGPAFKAAAMQLQRMREVMKQRSSDSTDGGPPSVAPPAASQAAPVAAVAAPQVAPPPAVPPVRPKPESLAAEGRATSAADPPVPSPAPRDVNAANSTRS
ncbi:hypothetical protein ABPG75_008095 [Micractinium tetrahymenae]